MNALAPLSVLRKRGIIRGRTTREQAEEIKTLFGIKDLDDEPSFIAAARRSNADETFTPTQKAWLACAQQKARLVEVSKFSAAELEELGAALSQRVVSEKDFVEFPKLFAMVGVKLVYVESFPSSKIDAAAFLQGDTPVIALSGRGQRMDKVLFALLHEVAHILLGHLDEGLLVLDELDSSRGAIEQAADAKASELLLPQALPRVPTRLGADWINSTASALGIHPILLIGRLQKLGKIPWRTALVRKAPNVSAQLQTW
jgi:HTH-type transcriptional regulator/antitoxin HigA